VQDSFNPLAIHQAMVFVYGEKTLSLMRLLRLLEIIYDEDIFYMDFEQYVMRVKGL